MNVVGGYVVTDRMLQMFRKKPTAPKARRRRRQRGRRVAEDLIDAQQWIYTSSTSPGWSGAACFVLGLTG